MHADPNHVAKKTPGAQLSDCQPQIDMRRLRQYRLGRLQQQLQRLQYGAAILFDPINIRYACGSRNMAVWTLRNTARYLFVPDEGKAVLFDYKGCEFMSAELETIEEVRPALSWFWMNSGPRLRDKAEIWADSIRDLVVEKCRGSRRVACDRLDPFGLKALEARGLEIGDGQEPCEIARSIKSADEIACMGYAISACEAGMARMREALRPGITENELWGLLNHENHRFGGEWVETRLLASGGRTNPWFQECSDRIVRAGDLVAFDTDLIGPFGYCADISRTYFCGPGRPTEQQRELYKIAMAQLAHNMGLLKAGVSFREVSEKAWVVPERFRANRYPTMIHGAGLADEWPVIAHGEDWARRGYDGIVEENMVLCIESYIGELGGSEGVKLEQQIVVTRAGYQLLSTFPLEDELSA